MTAEAPLLFCACILSLLSAGGDADRESAGDRLMTSMQNLKEMRYLRT
jgi:hypothetical protein